MSTLSSDALRMRDFSDRELLHAMQDQVSSNGNGSHQVEARDLAIRLFGVPQEHTEAVKYYTRCVGARMSWMRKFGFVERVQAGVWQISEAGHEMIEARPRAVVTSAINEATDAQSLSIANLVGEKIVHSGDVAAHAMRRELLFQIERRKRGAR